MVGNNIKKRDSSDNTERENLLSDRYPIYFKREEVDDKQKMERKQQERMNLLHSSIHLLCKNKLINYGFRSHSKKKTVSKKNFFQPEI